MSDHTTPPRISFEKRNQLSSNTNGVIIADGWDKMAGETARIRRWLLPLVPLLLLVVDMAVYPVFYETRDAASDVSGGLLVNNGVAYLGNYHAHRIYVSLDDISDPDYFRLTTAYLEKGNGFWSHGH